MDIRSLEVIAFPRGRSSVCSDSTEVYLLYLTEEVVLCLCLVKFTSYLHAPLSLQFTREVVPSLYFIECY